MIEKLLVWLGFGVRTRFVPVPQPRRVLDEGELDAAFAVAEDDALWLAVNQLLQDRLLNAQRQVSHPDLAGHHGPLAHTAGGLEWMSDFQAELHARWQGANGRRGLDPHRTADRVKESALPKESGKADSKGGQVKGPGAKGGMVSALPTDDELLNGE